LDLIYLQNDLFRTESVPIVFGLIVSIVVGPQMIVLSKTMTAAHGRLGLKCCTIIRKISSIASWSYFFTSVGQVIYNLIFSSTLIFCSFDGRDVRLLGSLICSVCRWQWYSRN
jgi:hypothetical protein